MKAKLLKSDLEEALGVVSRAVPSKTTMPILTHIKLLALNQGLLALSASNIETTVETVVECRVEAEGVCTVPAKKFTRYVRSLGDGPIGMSLGKTQLSVSGPNSRARFSVMDADAFPLVPDGDTGDVAVDALTFLEMLPKVSLAASTEESHRLLNGVLFQFRPGTLRLMATDGIQAARSQMTIAEQRVIEDQFIVPLSAIDLIRRLDDGGELLITTLNQGRQLVIKDQVTVISTSLLAGNYPNIERVFPTGHARESTHAVTVGGKELQDAVRRALIFSSDAAGFVQFDVGGDYLQVRSRGSNSEGQSMLAAQVTGDSVTFGLDGSFLDGALSAVSTPQVTIGLEHTDKPISLGEVEGDELYTYVTMPMALKRPASENGEKTGNQG